MGGEKNYGEASSSPRPWRCFQVVRQGDEVELVFSTSVEVFPNDKSQPPQGFRLLHVRGGVSKFDSGGHNRAQSSPRPWRCFQDFAARAITAKVFSTSVEVFLHLKASHN